MNPYKNIITAFEQLTAWSQHIKSFTHGPSDRLLDPQRSDIEYPVLHLDIPMVKVQTNHTQLQPTFHFSFALLDHAAQDNQERETTMLYDLLDHMYDCLFMLLYGYPSNIPGQNLSLLPADNHITYSDIEPITGYTSDNLWGWGIDITIRTPNCPSDYHTRFDYPIVP